MIVDDPFLSPLYKGRFLLPVGLRLETAQGQFDGLAVSVVLPDAFRAFFRTMDIGDDGIIWVIHPNAAVLFREPSKTDRLGETAADHPVVLAARSAPGHGIVKSALEEGGPHYISAYRTLTTPPLIVAVSLEASEILADWRAQRRTTAIGFTAFTVTLVGFVVVLFRQIDARARVEGTLEQLQRVEADRLKKTNQRLEEALGREKRAREETEEASRLKDEFLMTLSHELRTPLNAIVGWVRLLMSGAMDEANRARALATIERNANAQTHLVEDLLDVSRAITGKLRLNIQPVNVGNTVLSAVETLRPAITSKGIAFEAEADATLAPVLADSDRLQQVVWNLLSNAIKFTPSGGTVKLRVNDSDGGVEIRVRDSGSGIPGAFLPFVFDRFRQADAGTRRETGGLGLGLAIARHVVELHGGTMTAESEGEGQGATFRVFLPRLVQAPDE
ncbi:MAG: hypothetical protein H0W08_13695 [Acidobacteria bacterium]|nr:hypothetical protein [Acidobacteriota bacterium]